jgi:BASS family bile acid:Na+ symporter
VAALEFLGRHGTLMVALSIFVGLLVPQLASGFKPLLGEAIFMMLTLAFLRVDTGELRALFVRPGLVLAASAWVMLATPIVLGTLFRVATVDKVAPGLFFILILQMSAPGLMSSPALAALMGLDVALTLASLVVCAAATPVTATFFTHHFLGAAVISPIPFGFMLFAYIAGSALIAAVIRRIAGKARVEAQHARIDGLSVIAMFVFAVAAMDNVSAHFLADPARVAKLALLAFGLSMALIVLTTLIFLPAGRARAFAIGLIAGNRNLGLMLAGTGFIAPDVAWLYFGLAQIPIYLLPHLLKPLAARLVQAA